MVGIAFASVFVQKAIHSRGSPVGHCRHSHFPFHGGSRHTTSLSLQDVAPTKLPAPAVPLPEGTIFHILRATPSHLADAVHPIDGDGYALAVTLSPSGSFVRGRYVRTRAFLREARAKQRLYPSRGGTESSRKYRRLKKACADGIFVWSGKLFAWGDAGLPMWLDPATLVSRGYSALSAVLTDREELFRERGQAIASAPVRLPDGTLAVCASGAENSIFVSVIDGEFNVVQRCEAVQLGRDALVLDFAAADRFFAVLCARTVAPSAGAALRQVLSGTTAAPDVDVQGGAFLAFVPRSGDEKGFLVDLPSRAFCVRIEGVNFEGDCATVRLSEASGLSGALARTTLSDIREGGKFDSTGSLGPSVFEVDLSSKEAKCLDDLSNAEAVSGSTRVVGLSPCGNYASVCDAKGRGGIARIVGGGVEDISWIGGSGCASGVSSSGDGKCISALVSEGDEWGLWFWDADKLDSGAVGRVDLPRQQFGGFSRSWGSVWDAGCAKWPEGGKVVKSAYEIFDDRNWNDINSGFSSLGINQ